MRHHDEAPTSISHMFDVGRVEHGACTDQIAIAQCVHHATDTLERLRRIERHFEHAKAGVDQRATNVDGLVGRQTAQDGDEGKRIKP